MRICSDCFLAQSWPINARSEPSSGKCSFCGRVRKSWEPTAWSEHVLNLLDLYQPSSGGMPVGERIQQDWGLLRTSSAQLVHDFITIAAEGSGLDVSQLTTIEPKWESGSGLVSRWENLSTELRHTDRYFADGAPEFRVSVSELLRGHTTTLKQGDILHRARLHEQAKKFARHEIEAPPLNLCSPGRANPAGIRYLYLAYEPSTAVHEVRPQSGATVAIGQFTVQRDLNLFSLVTSDVPDFFNDGGSHALDVRALMLALADQLRAPVLHAAGPIDYVPTQYLCALVRAEGLDGVEYPSSLESDGTNVVLFDPDAAKLDGEIKYGRVKTVNVSWSPSHQ